MSTPSTSAEGAPNRRVHYRLRSELPCTFRLVQVAGMPLFSPAGQATLSNVSAGGCYFRCDIDLPIRKGVVCEFDFHLGGSPFTFKGRILRKLDNRFEYSYGVQFTEGAPGERDRLARLIAALRTHQPLPVS